MDSLPNMDSISEGINQGDHVIIPYAELRSFLDKFFCCVCHAKVSNLKKTTVGIATFVTNVCDCGQNSEILPERVHLSAGAVDNGNYRRGITVYALNVRLVLVSHLIGGSRTVAVTIIGMLALGSSLFNNQWHELEDALGVHVWSVTDDIVNENVKEELSGLLANELGYYDVNASGDGGWQIGGRLFDSISGHSMLIGKIFEKILAYSNYAKGCRKCEEAAKKGKIATAHNCPRNYEGFAFLVRLHR
jgi:hypothetical protein